MSQTKAAGTVLRALLSQLPTKGSVAMPGAPYHLLVYLAGHHSHQQPINL